MGDVPCGIDDHPMHSACKKGDYEEVERLIESGMVNTRSSCGKTPLMTAGYFANKEIMELLLENGAVVNAMDDVTHDTAAHYVALSLSGAVRQSGCMIVLAEHGADVFLRNDDGLNVLELAEKCGNAELAEAYSMVTGKAA
eukprot:RCo012292